VTASYRVGIHPEAARDLASILRNLAERILRAIEHRLSRAPDQYGERLRKSLRGVWKLRVGNYRVAYEILGGEVRVYGVMDRREVYDLIVRRLKRPEGRV